MTEEERPSIALAENIAVTTWDSISQNVIDRTKQRLADCVGIFSGGYHGHGNAEAVKAVRELEGGAQATIYNFGDKTTAKSAAFVNSLQIRSFDSDAVDPEGTDGRWPGHITCSTVPAALAVAEWQHLSGKEFVTALLCGDDMGARLSEVIKFSTSGASFDGNGTINCLSAAAAAAKALGLDAAQIHAAFGHAVNMCGGTMASTQGFWSFKLPNALSAHNGIWAAQLAKAGYKAFSESYDPLTGPMCFFDMFARESKDTTGLLTGLGEIYHTDMVIKPWSTCRGTHAALQTIESILQGRALRADEIKSVRIGCPPNTMDFLSREFHYGCTDESEGLFNLRFVVCSMLLTGEVTAASYSKERMLDPQIEDLLPKIELYPWDPSGGKAKGAAFNSSCVDLELVSGETFYGEAKFPIAGDVELTPLSPEAFRAKFEANARYGGQVDMGKLNAAYDMAYAIEQVDDISEFIELLVP
jgi:2-methylcitrate dehydratase PrpD